MKFFWSCLIGAIIGYVTNWLAIKMLFRPLKEVRVFGIKVPFTPGLIPKERKRIASSVGKAVSDHLLTPETIVKSLYSDRVKVYLEKSIKNKKNQLKESSITLGKLLKSILTDKYEALIAKIQNKITEKIIIELNKEEIKNKISIFILGKIKEYLIKSPNSLKENKIYEDIKNQIINNICTLKDSKAVSYNLENFIGYKITNLRNENHKFNEIIPNEVKDILNKYIDNNSNEISNYIKNVLKSESGERKLKDIINNMVLKNLSPMIAMFLSADLIYSNIISILDRYLENENNQKEITNIINNLIDELLNKNVGEFIDSIKAQQIETISKHLANILKKNIFDKNNVSIMINSLENNVFKKESLEELIKEIDENYEEKIKDLIHKGINEYVNNKEFELILINIIEKFTLNIEHMEIKNIISNNEDENINYILNTIKSILDGFIKKNAPEIINVLNITNIIEEKINEFDVEVGEKIILDIVSKELKAITWLGAVLGGIIGVISPILSKLV